MNSRLRQAMTAWVVLLGLLLVVPAGAQSQKDREKMTAQSELATAEAAVAAAEAVGAPIFAKDLYSEAVERLRMARNDWNSDKREMRQDATLRAVEARHAARAAEAKALLVAANTEIRNLRTDIGNFGGTAMTIALYDPPTIISRGVTSLDRVIVAENALQVARGVGGDQAAPDDLKRATDILKTARMLAKNRKQNKSADHLAYLAEMLARRAEYMARRNAVSPRLPEMRMERTRLAQTAADARAQEEQRRRLEAERQAADLRRQLEVELANRKAERAEVERLRTEVSQNDAQVRSRLEQDRAARLSAEQNLDQLMRQYEAALAQGTSTSVELDQLRRQVEDQSLTLRAVQERERQSEASLRNQINTLQEELERERREGRSAVDVIAQRENELRGQRDELAKLQRDREENERRRVEAESARTAAIAEAETKRRQAEAQTEQLRQQVLDERVKAQQTEAELARAREELTRRDTVNRDRIENMQLELSKLAETRTSDRGFIVTLPGLFFDSGKAVLKTGARNTLTKIADQLRVNEDTKVAVEGHTDSVGSEEMNQSLSEKRAAAVRDYLVSRGVPAARITISGQGEASPVATNDTAAGRQQNRRVELVISH